VALAWLIHTRMGEPLYLGLRAFAAEAPLLAFMLVGGAAADRIDRRRILLTSNVLQLLFAAVLGVLYVTGHLGIGAILIVAFATGLAQSQSAPTYQAVLTSLVPPPYIPNAVALNSLQFNLSRAIGPVIAGVLLARGGTAACFAVNVVSFLAVIAAFAAVRLPPAAPASSESLRESLKVGVRHVAGHRLLLTFMVLGGGGSVLSMPLLTYMPVIAGDALGTGARGYSLLLSSFGLGAILGAVSTAHRGNVSGRGRVLLLAFVLFGTSAAAAVLSGNQRAAMALLLVAGFSLTTAFSTLNSLVQELAPLALKGRVLSIYGLAFRGGMPVGSLLAGFLVGPLGAAVVISAFTGALALLAGAVYLMNDELRAV
jgi:predicted MFS family arabinose efflux permease